MPEKSIYTRPVIPALMRYHLRGIVDVMHSHNYPLVGARFSYVDADGEPHTLYLVNGDWLEGEVIA